MGFFSNLFGSNDNYKLSEQDFSILYSIILLEVEFSITNLKYSDNFFKNISNNIESEKFFLTICSYESLKKFNITLYDIYRFSNNFYKKNIIDKTISDLELHISADTYKSLLNIDKNKKINDLKIIKIAKPLYSELWHHTNVAIQGLYDNLNKFRYDDIDTFCKFFKEGIIYLFGNKDNSDLLTTDPRFSIYLYTYYRFRGLGDIKDLLPNIPYAICFIYNLYNRLFNEQVAFIASIKLYLCISYNDISDILLKDLLSDIPMLTLLDKTMSKFSCTSLTGDKNDYTYIGINDNMRQIIFGN